LGNSVTQGMVDAGVSVASLFNKSKNGDLMTNEQISKVLIDNDTVKMVKKGESIKLKEGYSSALKA
jgi:hypothetical protein